ncbi:MAG: polyprenyl synthetase family protein [Chitinophagaceae bacterium]
MQLARKVIESELVHFENYYHEVLQSDIPLLNRINNYHFSRKGKQMRPMFVLLSARLAGEVNEASYRAAVIVEMLHTSSLVHDDLVDDSLERRGAFSVNALWNNKAAIWSGDYLFAHSVLLSLAKGDHQIIRFYSDAIQQMIEGELVQMAKSRKLNLDEKVYYEIITAKTASFLAAACAAGASTTFNDNTQVQQLHLFGKKTGVAFQLKDDLLDYGKADIGKPTGNDIKEKKLSLPLIYTLNTCEPSLKKKLLYILKHQNTEEEKVQFVINEVIRAGGIQYATEKMFACRDEALALLYEFPASETRSALEEMVRYTTDRSY